MLRRLTYQHGMLTLYLDAVRRLAGQKREFRQLSTSRPTPSYHVHIIQVVGSSITETTARIREKHADVSASFRAFKSQTMSGTAVNVYVTDKLAYIADADAGKKFVYGFSSMEDRERFLRGFDIAIANAAARRAYVAEEVSMT